MSRNEIRLDQIQQRLGKSNKPRQTDYDDYGYAIPQTQNEQGGSEGSGSTLNAGFIATIVAASLTVGTGTFFFIGGETPDFNISMPWSFGSGPTEQAFGSKLDPVCGKGWEANVPNTDQMYCYLTRQTYRLCDEGEYGAFIATVKRYDKDYKVWHRKFMAATFKSIGKMQTQGMQLGMEAAKLHQMGSKGQADMDQFNKVTSIASDITKPTDDLIRQRRGKVPEYELENAAYTLAKGGYITAKDFGRTKPDFLTKAFKRAGKVKTACPNRGA